MNEAEQLVSDGKADRSKEERVEQHILKFSMFFAFFFTLLGLVWGILAGSQMIVFDGLYSFVSVVLSSVSVYAAWCMKSGDDAKFPLGRACMEPMVIIFKSIVMVALCVIAFGKAVFSFLAGPQEVNALSAMSYALIGTFGCIGGFLYIVLRRRQVPKSELVKVEGIQWGMDALLSAAILLGFGVALLMERAGYAHYSGYVDPVMVMVFSVFFVKMPAVSLVEGIRDILQMAPDGETYDASRQVVERIAKQRGFDGYRLRMTKSGREFNYRIGFVSDKPGERRSLIELDGIRQEVEDALSALHDNPLWLGVSFMHDRKWS